MKKISRIIFMGTPDFAVPALLALHHAGYSVVAVVTQPDRPAGRGRQMSPSPAKKTAVQLGYDVIQPRSVHADEFLNRMTALQPDLFVVVAFGQILPKTLLEIPKRGAVNIHASLLPKYRGPAPIPWAIIQGEKETGISTMLLDEGMDTGDILLCERVPITADDTSLTLHDRLSDLGARVLLETLEKMESGKISARPQAHFQATYAPMLKKDDGQIPWQKSAAEIERFVRAMTPWPGAFTFHDRKRLKIFKCMPAGSEAEGPPGAIMERFSNELLVATGQGALSILEIQVQGGKRLAISDFLRGYKLLHGSIFGPHFS